MATLSTLHAVRINKVRAGFAAAAIPQESVRRVLEIFDSLDLSKARELANRTERTVLPHQKIGYTNGENRRQMARAYWFIHDLEYFSKYQDLDFAIDDGLFRRTWQKHTEIELKELLHKNIKALLDYRHHHFKVALHQHVTALVSKLPKVIPTVPDIVRPPMHEEMPPPAFDHWLESCAQEVDEQRVAMAFSRYTFVYGTMGKGSSVVKAARTMFSRKSRFNPEQQIVERELNLFDTGVRAKTYLHGDDTQMMDMYYGQEGNNLYKLRDPHIGAFLHKAMRFKGEFSPDVSGRAAYMATYNTTIEGWDAWDKTGPRIEGTTITVEMSRIIRWGVQRYSGKLTFEGKEIYYSQVFDRNSYKGDTEREALGLFPYFSLNSTHTVPFGKGKLTFMWNGVPTVPTHCHFLSNWGFTNTDEGLRKQAEFMKERREKSYHAIGLASFHKFSAKKDDDRGAQHYSKLNRGVFEEYLKQANVNIDFDLWNKFIDKPKNLRSLSNEHIVKIIQGA